METNVSSTIADIQSAAEKVRNEQVAAKNGSKLDKNAFLKLLTAQMSNQDPTKPMDNTAFVAQLAQFSTLEAQTNTNDTLGKLLTAQTSSQQHSAVSLVGKTAVFPKDDVTLTKGSPATISADLTEPAANVTMTVQNAMGSTVRVEQLGIADAGKNTFKWDGKDNDGDDVDSGTYTITLAAQNVKGDLIDLTQYGHERITSVSFSTSGEATIHAGASSLPLSKVSEISE